MTTRAPESSPRLEPGVALLTTDITAGPAGDEKVQTVACMVERATYDDVQELLDPSCWASLTDKRLVMRRLPAPLSLADGAELYQEVFTVERDVLCFTPRLVCRRRSLPYGTPATGTGAFQAHALEYRLADQPANQLIRVDQGSIVLREVDDGVRITATKRLRFAPPLDGPGLSIGLENLGYLKAFEDMIAAAQARGHSRATGQGRSDGPHRSGP